jgi:hypothetical protein
VASQGGPAKPTSSLSPTQSPTDPCGTADDGFCGFVFTNPYWLVTVSSSQGSGAAGHYVTCELPRCQSTSSALRGPSRPPRNEERLPCRGGVRAAAPRPSSMACALPDQIPDVAVYQAGTLFPEVLRYKRLGYSSTATTCTQEEGFRARGSLLYPGVRHRQTGDESSGPGLDERPETAPNGSPPD